jgi:hypothetical protein
MVSFGFKFMATLVQIDLLLAELKSLAIPESNGLHSQGVRVEIDGQVDIRNCKDKMIKVVDGQCHNGLH